MRAKIVNEKFKEESDPIKDMGIGGPKVVLDKFVRTLKTFGISSKWYRETNYEGAYNVTLEDDDLDQQITYMTDEGSKAEFDSEGGWGLFDDNGNYITHKNVNLIPEQIGHDSSLIIEYLVKQKYGNKQSILKTIQEHKKKIEDLKKILSAYES